MRTKRKRLLNSVYIYNREGSHETKQLCLNPDYVKAIPTNAMLGYFEDFSIQYYEEGIWQGDWGGPPAELVRLIAKK